MTRRRVIGLLASGVCLVAAALWAGSSRADGERPSFPETQTGALREGDAAGREASWWALEYRGLAIQLSTGIQAAQTYVPLLHEISELGANAVLLSVAGYMEHARSQAIFLDARRCPGPEDLEVILREARQLGLRVILMPIVLLSHPRGSEWRGAIDPPDWNEWWSQYRDFLLYFADIAARGKVEVFMVGSELVSTERQTDQWVHTIQLVRQRFPGKLGYSANWDHYKPIRFWERLDLAGITSYYTLADRPNPPVEEIVQRWRPIRDDLLGWQKQVGKPILLTEVGWCSQEGAATAPWNYYHNTRATPAGHEEQRRLYEAFLRAWHDAPGVCGVIWWEWNSAGGEADYGYTPRGKPAEKVLREWLARFRPGPNGQPARR